MGGFMPTETRSTHTVRRRETAWRWPMTTTRAWSNTTWSATPCCWAGAGQVDDLVRFAPAARGRSDLGRAHFAATRWSGTPTAPSASRWSGGRGPANEGRRCFAQRVPGRADEVRFQATPDAATGRLTALLDLTGSPPGPARSTGAIAFGADRHLDSFTSSSDPGTTFTLRLAAAS